jgi:hypothetical protein
MDLDGVVEVSEPVAPRRPLRPPRDVLGEQLVLGRGPRGRLRVARVLEPSVRIMH